MDEPTILHLDMDSFYVSVELLSRPELAGAPVIVGRDAPRSVVASAGYVARRFGVRSAMPVARAKQLCPGLVILEPHMAVYRDYSRKVMAILARFTPAIEQVSVDEAYLDVAGVRRLWGDGPAIAALLRSRIRDELGLPSSVGVAGSLLVAKLASARAKPDGVLVVEPGRTLEFLHPLPVRAIPGVGGASAEALQRLGVHSVGELAATPVEVLERALGAAHGSRLAALARGVDERRVEPRRVEKSIGHETTLDVDLGDPERLHAIVAEQAGMVAGRLRAAGLAARSIALKVRDPAFRTFTRSRTLAEPSSVTRRVAAEARSLLEQALAERGQGFLVRLIGVRAEGLVPDPGGAGLWDPDERWREVDSASDRIADRFGAATVRSAASLRHPR